MAKQDAPRADAEPVRTTWKLVPSVQVDQQALERAADQQARFLIATNELSADKLSDEALLAVYKGQGSVERGFRFLKDPLFLASPVFVKKPSRLIALSFIMVLCLLVYRLAEQRLRQRLHQSEQTIPNQINKPTDKPTMRLSCSNALKVLNCSIFAWDRPFKLAFYVCNPCTTRSSACLALPTNNSIFCLLETAECGLTTACLTNSSHKSTSYFLTQVPFIALSYCGFTTVL